MELRELIFNLIAGEWWNASVVDVVNQALATGGAPNDSVAFTINGKPGDLYPCSQNRKFIIDKAL